MYLESRNTGYNAIHLSGIVHQKGGLNFFNIELSKTVLTSKFRLHVPTQHA